MLHRSLESFVYQKNITFSAFSQLVNFKCCKFSPSQPVRGVKGGPTIKFSVRNVTFSLSYRMLLQKLEVLKVLLSESTFIEGCWGSAS
jgi:hypothetical protein